MTLSDQGGRDAIALFNRYGCDGDVTHTVIQNINALFDPTIRGIQPPRTSQPVDNSGGAVAAQPSTKTYRTPAMFNCAKASMGADFVICAFPDLLDAEADLEDAYTAARSARGDVVKSEQIAWMKSYGPNCGLPFRGRPTSDLIGSAHGCVLSAMRRRIAELKE
jgi:uncharacterized protein YecT (DUF1311 family)